MKISIIVTAYNRRNYIMQAIKSIEYQNIDPSEYELIVITNFDIELNVSTGIKVSNIVMNGSIGEFLYTGIRIAKYDLIAFLDDDDVWQPAKLSKTMNVFRAYPEVVFYRNSLNYIGPDGSLFHYRRIQDIFPYHLKGLKILCNEEVLSKLPLILTSSLEFNLSTMVVRKEVLIRRLEQLKSIVSGQDAFVFWSALDAGKVAFDDEALTLYRVHNTNVSGSLSYRSKSDEILRQARTYQILFDYEKSRDLINRYVLNWLNLLNEEYFTLGIIFDNGSKKKVRAQLVKLIEYPIFMLHTMRLEVIVFAAMYVISPKATLFLYGKLSCFARKK